MASDQVDSLYSEAILDHARRPRNPERLYSPDLIAHSVNPFCGDENWLQVRLDSDRVALVGMQSEGCSINKGSASMLAQAIEGKTLSEIETLSEAFDGLMRGDALTEDQAKMLGDLGVLEAVRRFPIRVKCALLPWVALREAMDDYHRPGRE